MDENENSNYEGMTNTGTRSTKSYRDQTPDEVKESVKEKVAKGVAAVAGALKGFSEEAKKDDLAGSTKEAIQKAGETTRELSSAAKEEFRNTKETIKGQGSSGSSSLGSSDRLSGTMSSTGLGSSSSSLGSSSLGSSSSSAGSSLGSSGSTLGSSSSNLGSSKGMGGSELGTGSSLHDTSTPKSTLGKLDEDEE